MMELTMDMALCQRRLAILWFSTCGAVFLLALIRIMFHGIPDDAAKQVWGFLLPNMVPTLSLMIAVLVAEAVAPPPQPKQGNRFLFQMAFWLSAAYLAVFLLMVLVPFGSMKPLMDADQQIWLTPLQGLATAALGAFFVKTS